MYLRALGETTTHIYGHSGYGPTFGSNHDLYLNLDSFGSSYSNVGGSYTNNTGENTQTVLAGVYQGWSKSKEVIDVSQKEGQCARGAALWCVFVLP